ncbi:NAD(P)/FAD-dependent oxidoreductase [Desulfoplanes sp. PS50]|jgi:NAD(P)H-nitrite reductase large subunit
MKTIIIGMGPAGLETAKTLREHGYAGEITMFAQEETPPYSPPVLGEYLLTGNENTLFWKGTDVCSQLDLDCRMGESVVSINPDRMLLTSDKGSYEFAHLVIASGSSLHAPLPGVEKPGICHFKTLEGTRQIRKLADNKPGSSALIVGGGFIGVEIALCLAKIGLKPILLNRRGWIMPRLLDQETSDYVLKDLKKAGIDVRLGTEATAFIGKDKVEGITTAEGQTLTADLYIAATGVKPNIDFLKNSGITCKQGVVVNEYLQTNIPFIHACGDVAETRDLVTGNTKIHGLYPVAVAHGRTVAMNIMGAGIRYEQQLNMNSLKELTRKVIVVGQPSETVIKRKSKQTLRKMYLKDGKITGFVLVGDISGAGMFLGLMRKKADVSSISQRLLSRHFSTAYMMTGLVRKCRM